MVRRAKLLIRHFEDAPRARLFAGAGATMGRSTTKRDADLLACKLFCLLSFILVGLITAGIPLGMVLIMWKKMILASAVTGLLAGVAIPIHSTPAEAARSGCFKAAKARFPHDYKARKAFRHWCKGQWKLYKAGHRGHAR